MPHCKNRKPLQPPTSIHDWRVSVPPLFYFIHPVAGTPLHLYHLYTGSKDGQHLLLPLLLNFIHHNKMVKLSAIGSWEVVPLPGRYCTVIGCKQCHHHTIVSLISWKSLPHCCTVGGKVPL